MDRGPFEMQTDLEIILTPARDTEGAKQSVGPERERSP